MSQSTSSLRPSDLTAFASQSAVANTVLRTALGRIKSDYADFTAGTSWARFDAGQLLAGFESYLGWNDRDVEWATTVAAQFEVAGGSGAVSSLPDAALEASLRAHGLEGARADLTFDAPSAYGNPPTTGYADDPVNTASGNFVHTETDTVFEGQASGLSFARTYNSRSSGVGVFGTGWSCWADVRLRTRPEGADLVMPDGREVFFPRLGDGYDQAVSAAAWLHPAPESRPGFVVSFTGGLSWEFDAAGRVVATDGGPGTRIEFDREDGRLTGLRHSSGRALRILWEDARVTGLLDETGDRRIDYGYDEAGRLTSVTGALGRRGYRIGADGRVAAVTDADGVHEVQNVYDAEGRVRQQTSAFGRTSHYIYLPGHVTVVQDADGTRPNTWIADAAGRLIGVVDAAGNRQSTSYDAGGNPVLITDRSGGTTVQEFDRRGNLLRRVDPGGTDLRLTYDDRDRVVETSAVAGGRIRYEYLGDERQPARIIDGEGGVTELEVVDGLVVRVTDPDGVVLRFGYDAYGDLVAVTDADGAVARLERNPAGRVVAAITPEGRRTTYSYNDSGLLAARTDPVGATWRYAYTTGGRATGVTDPLGATARIEHGGHGLAATTTDPLGHATATGYDDLGNPDRVTLPDGSAWQFGYDALSRRTAITDPTGNTWRTSYDADGNLVASVDPLGVRVGVQVDSIGRPTGIDDGTARIGARYDAAGRMVADQAPDGSLTRFRYDRCGRPVEVTDAENQVTRYEYTPAGKVARISSPSGATRAYTYDACGRVASLTDPDGARTTFGYTPDGAAAQQISPGGEVAEYSYDLAGRLARSQVPGSGVTYYTYDPLGRLTETVDRLYGRRRFTYDPAGRLVAATDGNGNTTSYTHDATGRLTSSRDPLGGEIFRSYDATGRIASITDPLGRTTTAVYDAAGRQVEQLNPDGVVLRWTYDRSGRESALTTVAPDGTDSTYTVDRDPTGRQIRLAGSDGPADELTWDARGRLIRRARGDAALAWEYDPDGRRTAFVHPDGSRTGYEYDAAGRLAAIAHPAVGRAVLTRDLLGRLTGMTAPGVEVAWAWADGNVTSHTVTQEGVTTVTRIDRDEVGRVTAVTRDGGTTRYGYDPAGQLTGVTTTEASTSFTYDRAGRMTAEISIFADGSTQRSTSYDYDAAGQLLTAGRSTYTYDGAGRRTSATDGRSGTTYSWDARGHLTGLTSRAQDGSVTTRTLRVDALGELARIDDTDLYWDTADPWSALAQVGDVSVVGNGSTTAISAPGHSEWLAANWRGMSAEATGDEDPWLENAAPPATPGLDLGPGNELLIDGLAWLRARPYDPTTRAFLTKDPLPPITGTPWAPNPYSYAGNNPVAFSDPLGLQPVTDAQLNAYRDSMDQGFVHDAGKWVSDHRNAIIAGALIVGGVAVMFTGVGGPLGAAMIGGALVSAGGSAAVQQFTTGSVNWGQVAVAGVVGAGAGGLGFAAGSLVGGMGPVAALSPIARGVIVGGVENIVGGATTRAAFGENPFDLRGLAVDTVTGSLAGGGGAKLAARNAARTALKTPEVLRVGDVKLSAVPRGAVGTPVQTGKGVEYGIPEGTPEISERVTSVRIMDPVTAGKYQYPKGYAVYMNSSGQTINPLTGQTIANSDPYAHIPLP